MRGGVGSGNVHAESVGPVVEIAIAFECEVGNMLAKGLGCAVGAALGLFSVAHAAPSPSPPQIVVVGIGTVETPPDVASLTFNVRGEGQTADQATAALVAKRKTIESGLAALDNSKLEIHTSDLSILEARDKACDDGSDENQLRLSSGNCAVHGYVAQMSMALRITPPDRAGTALGLASRLGASDARIAGFELRDQAVALRQADAAAVADARARAEGIAASSGVRLGPLLSVEDREARDIAEQTEITVTANARPAAKMLPPPIAVDVSPTPIVTEAKLIASYGVAQ